MTSNARDEALFLELVLVFQQSAWIALGKIQNPQTGHTEVDLKGASHAIDMLSMLKTKSYHSLSATERALIDNALTQLRLNYVEAASEAVAAGGKEQPSGAKTEPPKTAEDKPTA
jgi:hypothetical protein